MAESNINIEAYLRRLAREEAERVFAERSAPAEPDWLTVEEAASLTRYSKWAIYEAIKHQEIPAKRLGLRGIRVRRRDALAWMEKRAAA